MHAFAMALCEVHPLDMHVASAVERHEKLIETACRYVAASTVFGRCWEQPDIVSK